MYVCADVSNSRCVNVHISTLGYFTLNRENAITATHLYYFLKFFPFSWYTYKKGRKKSVLLHTHTYTHDPKTYNWQWYGFWWVQMGGKNLHTKG